MMAGQASLVGFDEDLAPTDRLFFAIFPDAPAAARIAGLAQGLRDAHGLTGKPLKTERFHVTLHHLGDYPGLREDITSSAIQAASAVAAHPFELIFDRAASFTSMPRNRPYVLRAGEGVEALMSFQQALGQAMKVASLGRWARSGYTPHVTLLYDDRGVAEQPVEPVSWTAHEFVLVHSKLGENKHVRLGSWPLKAA